MSYAAGIKTPHNSLIINDLQIYFKIISKSLIINGINIRGFLGDFRVVFRLYITLPYQIKITPRNEQKSLKKPIFGIPNIPKFIHN